MNYSLLFSMLSSVRACAAFSVLLSSGASALESEPAANLQPNSSIQEKTNDGALAPIDTPGANAEALVVIDTDAPSVPSSRMIFGGFLEHFHKQIYGGIFEPGSPLSDERGFRKDVIEAMKELKLSVVRWPGGCFASGYRWKDGVGRSRTPVSDPVWGVTDPNTFGTDEFVEWCRLVGCEPYICTNAGNGTPEEMRQWVEYCNAVEGEYADLRRAGGHEQPLGVKIWSIGNENWGGHEIGASTPDKWGPLVHQSAERMLGVDDEGSPCRGRVRRDDPVRRFA